MEQILFNIMQQVKVRRWSKRNLKESVKYGSIVLLFTSLSACGMTVRIGTPEAVRAMGDADVAPITEGKASPDIKSAYYQAREHREVQETSRQAAPDFLTKLWGGK